MGLFSFVGGLIGGGKSKKASLKAEAAQLQYLTQAIGEQRRQFDLTRSDFAPYLETGTEALAGQGDLLGLNGAETQDVALKALMESPLFKTIFGQGEEAILQNASATGGLRGGNTNRSLADFGADTFARVLQEQLAQLGGLSGRGQQAAGSIGGFGANSTNSISNLLSQQGQVRAGGLLTRGGINAQNWQNAGSFIEDAIKSIFGGSGMKF